jgi:hypothetical protein
MTKSIPPDLLQKESYNVTIYDIQSLPFRNHIVTVQALTWAIDGKNRLWFDYVAVNDANPSLSSNQ